MDKMIKNVLLAGIGTVAYTYEKGMEMVEELVKKGELTINQGKELNEELKKKMGNGCCTKEDDSALTVEKLKEVLGGLNLATRQEIDELKERISKLENK